MGLAIVEAIAHAHEGRVRAENHPEGGAQVTLLLPVSAKDQLFAAARSD